MRTETCIFSGFKIYPGHGKCHIKADGKVLTFISRKAEFAHLKRRKNPRMTRWTFLYRVKNKKGTQDVSVKKRTRRTHKYQKAVVGASLTEIINKRNQKPEVRKAQREEAVRAAKEKARALKAKKAPAQDQKAASKAQKKAPQQKKTVAPKAPRVGGKR